MTTSKVQPGPKRLSRFILRLTAILLALGILALLLPRLITTVYARSRLFNVKDVPPKRVAIVFGARVLRDGSPSPALKDRVATAADLYFAGKVEKLLMSGDNRFVDYNEPQGMKDYAMSLGVPEDAIVLDYAGRRTYDTCYRARDIFEVHDAILVTSDYHQSRAIYICDALGVKAVGVPAERRFALSRRYLAWMQVREFPAALLALWDMHVSRPLPVLGEPEPIFASGSTVLLQPLPAVQVTLSVAAGLTIEEYPIVAADVDTPSRFEFLDLIPDDVLARRADWRGLDPEQHAGAMNEKLTPFGYRLVAEENAQWNRAFYDLYRGGEQILSNLSYVWPVTVNESGTDFVLVAENAPNKKPLYLLIHKDSVEELDWTRFVHGVVPVYLGDDLFTVESVDNLGTGYAVKRNGEVVYTYTPGRQFAGSPPVERLLVWEGHWILETVEGVFVDGESLERQLGIDEIFHYIVFQGQPLFFFKQDGRVQISCGGETLLLAYDEVVHYQCCEPAVFNIGSNDRMLWFYALKDGTWHYVEIGMYE
jgi:SanA protein